MGEHEIIRETATWMSMGKYALTGEILIKDLSDIHLNGIFSRMKTTHTKFKIISDEIEYRKTKTFKFGK